VINGRIKNPIAMIRIDPNITGLIPIRSLRVPTKGAHRPDMNENARERLSCVCDQPNCSLSGPANSPNAYWVITTDRPVDKKTTIAIG